MIAKLFSYCEEQGIRITAIAPDRLNLVGPTNVLREVLIAEIIANKQQILTQLNKISDDWKPESDEDWVSFVDVREVEACEQCGSWEVWETLAGGWRCQKCDPPTASRRFFARRRDPQSKYERD